ncbi:hypothetical protein PsorP6_008513 [Peronosclerospora sorghi]|uniref:Uncharacterized protein n=1 Tax=Peronosclerospora sorghi TaxID=230839 RepID=A0ACC0W7K2_9STRA|nr:hypothetical protein PsorP6_008513 [Peronosclerospora sorghi]
MQHNDNFNSSSRPKSSAFLNMQLVTPEHASLFVYIKQAWLKYFSSKLSVQDAADCEQFRAQMLYNHDEDKRITITQIYVGLSDVAYVTQLAVILETWHRTGINPLLTWLKATEEENMVPSIEGVQLEFTSRQHVFKVCIDTIHRFIDVVRNSNEENILRATISLVDELGGSRGILTLLGFQQTRGSQNLAPLTLRQCLTAFTQRHTRQEPLTVGARAYSKHCVRCSSGWWGELKGNDFVKNERAEEKVRDLLSSATWKNIHSLPHANATMEVRNELGYGARWDVITGAFRGLLEPPIVNGHEVKWRH